MVKADYIATAVKKLDSVCHANKPRVAWQIAQSYIAPKSKDLPLLRNCSDNSASANRYTTFYVDKIASLSTLWTAAWPWAAAAQMRSSSTRCRHGQDDPQAHLIVQVLRISWHPSYRLEATVAVARGPAHAHGQRLLRAVQGPGPVQGGQGHTRVQGPPKPREEASSYRLILLLPALSIVLEEAALSNSVCTSRRPVSYQVSSMAFARAGRPLQPS